MAKLHFHFSVMNAGKTTQLLQVRHNYMENGGEVLLLTSAIDDRGGIGRVSSRMGLSAEAVAVGKGDDVFALVAAVHERKPLTVVLVDEVQFLEAEQVWQLARVVDDLGLPVMAYGLKNNVFGDLFGPAVSAMLALAEDIREIKQLCHCGRKATMILRYDPSGQAVRSGSVVEVGGDDRYVSVCRRDWTAGDIGARCRAALLPACEAA